MSFIAPAFVTVNPSFIEPELVLNYTQASGFAEALSGGAPRIRLSEGARAVYFKRLDLRTRMAAGQSASNSLPGVSIVATYASAPTYLTQVRAEYNHHDTAAAGQWGVSIVNAYRLAMRQGHFQLMRLAALFGFQPANGEGLLNTPGETTVSLPADSNGNTTIVTYDNGQLGTFFLSQIASLISRTNQLGIAEEITILLPQRIGSLMQITNIVQLTSYQRPGAGTDTTAGLISKVAAEAGIRIKWAYDDTLIGKGAGGTDAILIVLPDVKKPDGGAFNTNEFAKVEPDMTAVTLQYADMAAPREIPTPLAGGAIDVLSEMRITSGIGLRGEGVTVVSAQYQ